MGARLPLTPRMRRTMKHAEAIALGRGVTFVGTEHVLLALLDDERGIAGGTIHRLGYAGAIRYEIIRILDSDGYKAGRRDKSS